MPSTELYTTGSTVQMPILSDETAEAQMPETPSVKFSVVIPCWNQAQYLPSAIESVLAQTYKPHEIIVVNDGSPDETRYVATQYPVKYIEQTNRGLSSARNTGIMNMTGDWFYPLDADDMMTENCLKRVAETIAQHPEASIVAPSFKCFGKHEDLCILMPNPKLEDFKFVNGIPQNRLGCFSAVRKDALLEVGGYSTKMVFGWEDMHLWINLLSHGRKAVTIPEPLILYRMKEHSMIDDANAHATELTHQLMKDFPTFMQ